MKLYNSMGPNPYVVRMFLAEKGVDVPMEEVDIMGAENRQDAHLARNPAGGLPCLELDDGTFISEITAICEYFEDVHPEPALIGSNAAERAETRMWTRRIDLGIVEPMTNGFRYSEGLPIFQSRMTVLPDHADGLKGLCREKYVWLNAQMADRQYVCGDRFTLADMLLYCFATFGAAVGQPVPEEAANVAALVERIGARDSANA